MPSEAERAYNELRRLIEHAYAPGQRLPSERDLAALCGISFTPVRQALARLRAEDRVRTERGRGSFVAGQPAPAQANRACTIGILSPGLRGEVREQSFSGLLLRALERDLRKAGHACRYLEHEPRGPTYTRVGQRPSVERIPWNELDALAVLDVFDAEVLGHERLRAGPVLVVDQDATSHGLESVAFDDRQAGAIAARHLLGLGHRRIALVEEAAYHGRAFERSWLDRRLGFEEAVFSGGGDIHPDWRMRQSRYETPWNEHAEWRGRFEKILKLPPERRPTAVFAPSLEIVAALQARLEELELRVPNDLSTVTVHAPSSAAPDSPALGLRATYASCDAAALGARAAEVLLDVLRGRPTGTPPRLHTVPVPLHVGRTTARPR
ncbi:MAG: substrate-binding domain-containing protein [Planctomycetota bacterium]|nr:substrate-binding domain-containing protein [Planctomycetota bacterium]